MPDQITPNVTENVVLGNPYVRKVLNWVLGIAALVLPIAGIIDQYSDAIDWSAILIPAGAVNLFLIGALAVGVTVPNIPSKEKAIETVAVNPQ